MCPPRRARLRLAHTLPPALRRVRRLYRQARVHIPQEHAYEKAMQKEKQAEKIIQKALDVNLAWIVRNEFCKQRAIEDQRQALAEPVALTSEAQSGSPHRRNDTTRNSSLDIYLLGPSTSKDIVPVKIENIEDEYNENEPENMEGSEF
ncbi:unnamed protein product, partial [Brenthis ino]